jgi:hypothetical protein
MVSAAKLVGLFELVSNPKFIRLKEHNHQYIFFLLELFNNVIQYVFCAVGLVVFIKVR